MADLTIDAVLTRVEITMAAGTGAIGADALPTLQRMMEQMPTLRNAARVWEEDVLARLERKEALKIPVRDGASLTEMLATALGGALQTATLVPPEQMLSHADSLGRLLRALSVASRPAMKFDMAMAEAGRS